MEIKCRRCSSCKHFNYTYGIHVYGIWHEHQVTRKHDRQNNIPELSF